FANDQQAAGIFVDAMHQAKAGNLRVDAFLGTKAEMPRQSVEQGAGIIAITRMYHHSSGFMYHHYGFVFIADVQRNVFRDYPGIYRCLGGVYDDFISWLYFIIGFYRLIIDPYHPRFGSLLNFIACG